MNFKKFFLFNILALLIFEPTSLLYAREELPNVQIEPIKIVFIKDNSPYSLELPDGTPTGLYVDFWQLWSQVNHIPVQFIPDTFANSIDRLKNDHADLHMGLFSNSERKQWGEFSVPIHKVDTGIFFKYSGERLPKLRDMQGKKISVREGSFQQTFVEENFPELDIVYHNDVVAGLNLVLNNEIDAIVGEVPYLKTQIVKMGFSGVFQISDEILLTNEVHGFISKKNSNKLSVINSGIKEIPVDKIIALEKKWLPELKPFFSTHESINSLTLLEKEWLKEHSSFSLGIDKNAPPFEFVDDKGEFVGVSSEYVDILRRKLNIQLNPDFDMSWTDAVVALKEGKIDVMSGVVRTDERAKSVLFTEPYISLTSAIMTKKDSSFIQSMEDLVGKRVGIVKGFVFEEYVRQDYPEVIIVYSTSLKNSFEKIKNNEIDAVVGSLIAINNEIYRGDHNELMVAAFSPYDVKLSFAVRKGLEPLVSILNKALSKITTKEKSIIANNWFSVKVNVGTDLKVFIFFGVLIISTLLFIIIFVSRSNRKMQYEILERKKTEKLLGKLKDKAEKANQAKDDFLANMSHEFRTPMNAVVGMSHLLEDSGLTKIQTDYNKTLYSSAAALLVLIDDILDISKVEAGRLELEKRPFKLVDIIKNIEDQIRLLIDNQVVNLKTFISPQVPRVLIGDAVRLGQVLLNLANNAAKFTENGEIEIHAEVASRTIDVLRLKVSVSDTGIGMNTEQQKRLFKTYSQADSSITRRYGGTGLGLTISKKLVELMDGEIGMESEQGRGSCFFFTAAFGYKNNEDCLVVNKQKYEAKDDFSKLLNKKILLVDDNRVNLIVAKTMLTNAGMDVVTALNGALAIEELELANFDAVLMDIQMPEMDGFETTQYIRNEMGLNDLPIVAVSANVMKSDIKKSLDSGMNGHIGKPLNVRFLLQTLTSHLVT